MEQVIKETLRMFPVGPLILRKVQDDIKLGEYILEQFHYKLQLGTNVEFYFLVSKGYVLPKGTTCVICPIGTHHIPELYPNSWTFNPDNFSQENVSKRHKFSLIAFSGGPRGCIGEISTFNSYI